MPKGVWNTVPWMPIYTDRTQLDVLADKIVRTALFRNFEVRGVRFVFDGCGDKKFRFVREIRSADVTLKFEPVYENGEREAALKIVEIPGKYISFWQNNEKYFMECHIDNSPEEWDIFRFEKKDQTIPLIGSLCEDTCICSGEYMPICKELEIADSQRPLYVEIKPRFKFYSNSTVMIEDVFAMFSGPMEKLLARIEATLPVADEDNEFSGIIKPMPFAEPVKLFCFADGYDVKSIIQGKKEPFKLLEKDRYGLIGNQGVLRFLPLGERKGLPEVAFYPVLWTGIGHIDADTDIGSVEMPNFIPRFGPYKVYLLRIIPKDMNGVYVGDWGKFKKEKYKIVEELGWESRCDYYDRENDFWRMFAKTLVPAKNYKGQYKDPVYLFDREVNFDEIEVVSGPYPETKIKITLLHLIERLYSYKEGVRAIYQGELGDIELQMGY